MNNDKPLTLMRFDPALGTALKFNQDDLQANRVGGITDRQRTAIYSQMLASAGKGLLIGFIGLVIFLIAFAAEGPVYHTIINGDVVIRETIPANVPVIAAAGLLLILGLVISISMLFYAWRLRQDLKAGKVTTVNGSLTTGRNLRGAYIQVNGIQFRVNQVAVQSFQAEKAYMLYYVPHSKRILSAELVG
ncbi:MAG TPA: hypothetical protein VHL11_24965 [Phototrophicaceae bacterium]|nr:hypothetical protein [Phototrophicaceae bacterium]